jgi:hypothetical protein
MTEFDKLKRKILVAERFGIIDLTISLDNAKALLEEYESRKNSKIYSTDTDNVIHVNFDRDDKHP